MRYRVTVLSPTLVGDGQRLSPIDYMVWKDHVNVLDQRRIFKLLAKGPRLDGYLSQLKRAERLDFASWGGFAQNFAGRRIPFEHPTAIPAWERAQPQDLFIPTFASTHEGPYLPATAIKGALRTGTVADRFTERTLADIARRLAEDRVPRNPAQRAEDSVLGGDKNPLKSVATGDSRPTSFSGLKVHLVRTTTLVSRAGKVELGWKTARGNGRMEEAIPLFVEMAVAGTAFEGSWQEKTVDDRDRLFAASNRFSAAQLAAHKHYAETCGMKHLADNLERIEQTVGVSAGRRDLCVLCLGWGGGLLSKAAVSDISSESYRHIARQFSYYERSIQTGLPFPKTRKIVFEGGQPASLPGWIQLEVS